MNLKTTLYNHQQQAVDKLILVKVGGLFMEMGTGKTRTALELISMRRYRITNIIWFCPCSIKWALKTEIEKHINNADAIYVFSEATHPSHIPINRLHIVGIESLSNSDKTIFCLHKIISPDSYIILDESFYIKNPVAQRTIRITELSKNCRYKLILTGTPIAHSIIDLYSQIYFLSPKIFGYTSFYAFTKNHIDLREESYGYSQKPKKIKYLIKKLTPYIYQVEKKQCLDLPDKIYQPHYYEMSWEQRDAYELAKQELLFSLESDDFNYSNILKLFTVLQQITCGFCNYRGRRETFDNPRIKILSKILDYISPTQPILIFCKYLYDIDIISILLKQRNESFSLYHGKLSEKDKKSELENFLKQNRIFLATLGSGGHGLTLNKATYTIFYNNTFSYTKRIQAEDRNHRIGQSVSPNYIDIICKDSIDTNIEYAFARKSNVVDNFKTQLNHADKARNGQLLETL